MHRSQGKLRRTIQIDHFIVFDKTIHRDTISERLCGETMRSDSHSVAQMRSQSVDAPDMIRMHVSQDYFPYASAFGNQRINRISEGLLFVSIRRAGIDDEKVV
jgi:hypothetical protein